MGLKKTHPVAVSQNVNHICSDQEDREWLKSGAYNGINDFLHYEVLCWAN